MALITGGDSGIGRAVAVLFAREGADVAIGHLAEEETDANETVKLVEAEGRRCLTLPGDVGDEAFCRDAVPPRLKRQVSPLGCGVVSFIPGCYGQLGSVFLAGVGVKVLGLGPC